MELSNKVAIITGGGSGMGRSFSVLFAREGAKIVVVDMATEAGTETVGLIKKAGGEATFVFANVTKAEDAMQAVKKAVEAYGRVDLLVNNAGIQHMGTVVQTSEADWDKTLATNLKSMFLMSKYAVPEIAKNGGVVINMASDAGLIGNPNTAAYSASKGGVIALTRAMALDHAAEGIRVNCICPGAIDTPLLERGLMELTQEQRDGWRARVKTRYPLGRIGKPEEVAEVALFLASGEIVLHDRRGGFRGRRSYDTVASVFSPRSSDLEARNRIMHYDEIVSRGLQVIREAGIDERFVNLGAETQSQNKLNRKYIDSLTFEMRILGSVVPETRTRIFGVDLPAPIMPAAIISSRILDRLAERESGRAVKGSSDRVYIEEYAAGVRDADSLMWWGADSKNEMIERSIKEGTKTVLIVKPMRDKEKAKEVIAWAEEVGCVAVGMDIDAMFYEKAFDEDEGPAYLAPQTIDDLRKYRDATKLPFIVKGVLSVHDAKIAVDEISCDAIVVSTHGGESIDYAAPVLKLLPGVRKAVGDSVEILVDSGFRRGTDVLKALALGADGANFGSLMVQAFAAYKREGITVMLQILYRELQRAMTYTGCPSVEEIDSSILHFL